MRRKQHSYRGGNVYISKGDKVIAGTQSTNKGSFILHHVEAGKYTLFCTHIGYSDYTAEIQVPKETTLDLGTLVMYKQSIQLNDVFITVKRNVFTTEKQLLYPSDQQIETSGGGLELLQKLPIPLLDVNPIRRTISSSDPLGGVALFINDIPADVNDFVILDPKQVKRVEVIRHPGIKYDSNLAIAINIVLKQTQDGVGIGINTANSTKATYGNNSLFATYNRKYSQLTVHQSENYQNYSKLLSEELRQYLMPDGNRHTMHIQSLSARTLSATHNTTLKCNLAHPDNYIFQIQGSLNLQRSPKQNSIYLVNETGKNDETDYIHNKNRYESPALNLYFKKYLPKQQALMFNVVGTHIHSVYHHHYEKETSNFQTTYNVEGRKSSAIGEVKYCKDFQWGNLTSGLRSFYSDTRNHYTGNTNSKAKMIHVNSHAYVQTDARYKQLSGNISLSLDDQYYTQKDDKYHKLTFNPQVNLNYAIVPNLSIGYGFNLASRLPSLASMNNSTIRLDQWERRTGNPYLKPFNHTEHSLKATYYKANFHAMWSTVYASNRHAIMPTIIRTETDGEVFFDNGVQNQRNMKQWVMTAYLRYAVFNNKLIVSGSGSYNQFHAQSNLYTNRRGFFYGNLALESYLGAFYLSCQCASRYNSLFAETVWYNEYSSSVNASYTWKNLQAGITWEQPLQRGGTNNRVVTNNNVIQKVVRQRNPEAGNHVLLTLSWRWNRRLNPHTQEIDLNNQDTDNGILK